MLRDYQQEIVEKSLSAQGNVLIQADTGAGKTRILAEIAKKHENVLIVAHRTALVAQLSVEFAKSGLRHGIIAAKSTARRAELLQRWEIGHSLIGRADCFVCSVDTLISKHNRNLLEIDKKKKWLIIVDEAHHMTSENKWGKLCDIFVNSRIIGATATPCRLDGKPLKRGAGGVFDVLIQAENLKKNSIRKLIDSGFISQYKCFGVEPRFEISQLKMGKSDYTTKSLVEESKKHVQHMAGDAVKHYKKLAYGKQAVLFCVSIELAKQTSDFFKNSGIKSGVIHSKMGQSAISNVIDLFKQKRIHVLCNVDMFGEGVDIPAIECLIMLRKTASLSLYRQWIGRSLRPCDGKEFALIIDHADNIKKHGLPDADIAWSLNSVPEAKKSNLINCRKCNFLVKAWEKKCPECGALIKTSDKNPKDVEYIDYNLVELQKQEIDKKQLLENKRARDNQKASNVCISTIKGLNVGNHSRACQTVNKIALWFFENIKKHATVRQAESFFMRNNNINYWASNFTLADLQKNQEKKCLRLFYETLRN